MEHLGISNDIVNKIITAYDAKYIREKRIPITSQKGDGENRPMESYSLVPSQESSPKYATYISTPGDLTVLFVNASKLAPNPNSIFKPNDVFISFKGSSTLKNFKHDILSQITPKDLGQMIASIGIQSEPGNIVTGAFVKPILKAWMPLMKALAEHADKPNTRLFLTGHSLGGAYTTLFAFILAEGKAILPQLKNIQSIHLITFGAPCIFSDKARNTFNAHLDSGFLTIDRVVSQKIPARSAATQLLVGGIAGPNDIIPTIPMGFSHPGFRPLALEYYPEKNGRPYSIDNVRRFYGVPTNTRYRDPTTWPFLEAMNLGDRANAAQLNAIVKQLTGETPPPEVPMPVEPPSNSKVGAGLFKKTQKNIYSEQTKTHIPNFLSVQGSAYAYGFAHAEYLGMFFLGGFRLYGMKNPAAKSIAYFSIYNDGVKITYVPKLSTDTEVVKDAEQDSSSVSLTETVKLPVDPSLAVGTENVPVKGGKRKNKTKKTRRAH